MKKLIKQSLSLALALLMVLSLAACASGEKSEEQGTKSITVMVIHKDGTIKEYAYETEEEFLGPLLEKEGVIEGQEGQYGMVIAKADGEKAVYEEDQAYWSIYENDQYALQGIDTTPIKDGSVYKLVYTLA